METMYKGIPFSPTATLTANISATDTVIPVTDVSAFPDAPNIATIGVDVGAETIIYAGKTTTSLTGCTRGIEGTAKEWSADEIISRNFTAKDHADMIKNIEYLGKNKLDAKYKVDVVNTNDISTAGKALDARQNNPNVEGTLAKKIADNTNKINVLEEKFSSTNVDDSMLRNGWTNHSQVVLTKIGNKVFCHGAINGGTQEQWTVLMKVPSVYTPSYIQYFDITTNNGWGSQSSKILCRIFQDGNIQIGEAIQSTFIYFDCSWEV